ncbi:glycoside hydrolase domain-containing protein [uncultured Rikenella sp.]|uniref:DUF4091 domain-containing protein n=1 Tax=uncultured Rikenella sp. TaxID=368003 RepID=UPI00260A1EB5|nr:glycoside hydrolase domain-containing protein [uncultured Rikenella sp.]
MRQTLILCALLLSGSLYTSAQTAAPVSAGKYPLGDYTELTDTKPHDGAEVWSRMKKPVELAWGNTDTRYKKLDVPKAVDLTSAVWRAKAWRGERINGQAVLWSQIALEDVTVTVSDLRSRGGAIIPAGKVSANFVRYVMTDELNKDGKGGCGHRPKASDWDSSVVADVIDTVSVRDLQPCSAQPVWVNIWVPREAQPGLYKGVITVSGKNLKPMKLAMQVDVVDRTLPKPEEWKFHLDLWQNPYAVARYCRVPLWSKAHFDAMRPLMKRLRDAGQKVVTATIMHKPWAGQTEDFFDSMIAKTKKIDGSWTYDYTVFDKWVDFMLNDVGIDAQIDCYTMIPWALSFDYFDQATGRVLFVDAAPGDSVYTGYWLPFLKDFSRHLRERGWFDRAAISMDERPMRSMQEAIKLIREADPEFKITLAGNYHDEIQGDLYDLSIPYTHRFPEAVRAERKAGGRVSTVYVCCTEAFPNTFTFSPPAEAAWLPVHAVAGDYDGLLRWTYNSWTDDPLRDSRFRTWAAGDCYIVYPGDRSSIRFERLIEGIQDAEKIRILREVFKAEGADDKLEELDETVALFTPEGLAKSQMQPEEMLIRLRSLLNSL